MLVDALGGPDRAYPIIHVAGTKGKGSTCAFIESITRHCGLRTGMFVTPHLHSVRERIQIDGQPVTEDDWAAGMSQIASAIANVEAGRPELGRVTAFELNTALALLLLQHHEVELGIIEVGLGGRLDATNIVAPRVTTITPVSYDHQAILGDSLAAIASEKAGIIKPGIPVIVGPQEGAALGVIQDRAQQRGATLWLSGIDWQANTHGRTSTFTGPWGKLSDVELGLTGPHQTDNAGVVLAALWKHVPALFDDEASVRRGLEATTWAGRFEVVNRQPKVVVDGAHNVASVEVLVNTLLETCPGQELIFVFGSYRDKDLAGMLAALAPVARLVVATRSSSPRAVPTSDIRAHLDELSIPGIEQGSVAGALRLALEAADEETVIVATGSLSIVAEAREFFGLGTTSSLERDVLSG